MQQRVNSDLQIRGHGLDLGLSQSREMDNGQMADGLPCQWASGISDSASLFDLGLTPPTQRVSSLLGSHSGIPLWDSEIQNPNSPDPKSACKQNKPQTLVGHKHASKASGIAFCCWEEGTGRVTGKLPGKVPGRLWRGSCGQEGHWSRCVVRIKQPS